MSGAGPTRPSVVSPRQGCSHCAQEVVGVEVIETGASIACVASTRSSLTPKSFGGPHVGGCLVEDDDPISSLHPLIHLQTGSVS